MALDHESQIINSANARLNLIRENSPEGIVTDVDILDSLNRAIDTLKDLIPPPNEDSRQRIIRQLEYNHSFVTGTTAVLESKDEGHVPWYRDRKAELMDIPSEMVFWKKYRQHLLDYKHWPDKAVSTIDETTDRVMELLEDPNREGLWDRRGMVIGLVQSGKTANYSALVAKAADCGYKLIVILAGQTNNLRSQTQLRLDEAVLGIDTRTPDGQTPIPVGVGNFGPHHPTVRYLTSSDENGDFKRDLAKRRASSLSDQNPMVLIVKKNKSILENLANWFANIGTVPGAEASSKHSIAASPILLIDDEADHSSIDTMAGRKPKHPEHKEYDPTAINRAIRTILQMFRRSVYIGYTATPFANIFISQNTDHEVYGQDLYPRHFMIRLPQPSSYIGPVEVFGLGERVNDHVATQGLDIVRYVDDHDDHIPDGHKNGHPIRTIPYSLKNAIKSFILVCAARLSRKEKGAISSTPHNSMLIHVTRFNSVQNDVAELVKEEFFDLKNRIMYGAASGPESNLTDLRELWKSDFQDQQKEIANRADDKQVIPVTWKEVRGQLKKAVSRTDVKTINGTAGEVLAYHDNPQGINVIAIGGDKLSRGLTLEGLSVSYYLRASRMYDTLLQMGRWFGYRIGFVDLCRLYTTPTLSSWFKHIALANIELHDEFDRMALENKSPEQFSLKVRTHPAGINLLQVTSGNKRRMAHKVEISYGNSMAETFALPRDKSIRQKNKELLDNFVNTLGSPLEERKRGPVLQWKEVSPEVVTHFLANIETSNMAPRANGARLADYIKQKVNKDDELTEWHIAIHEGKSNNIVTLGTEERLSIKPGYRSPEENQPKSHSFLLNRYRLIGGGDEDLDLTKEQISDAFDITRSVWKEKGSSGQEPKGPNPLELRRQRNPKKGLLLIYVVEPRGEEWDFSTEAPYIGFAVSFPNSSTNRKVTYLVDQSWWKLEYGIEPDEEEDEIT
jgi:hypothetical protein